MLFYNILCITSSSNCYDNQWRCFPAIVFYAIVYFFIFFFSFFAFFHIEIYCCYIYKLNGDFKGRLCKVGVL
jgi:hypothetical protein